jgi:hypothetical protein
MLTLHTYYYTNAVERIVKENIGSRERSSPKAG